MNEYGTVAFYFHPEAYSASGKRLMGRNAAGESFLKGYLKHAHAKTFYCYVKNNAQGRSFEDTVRQYRNEPVNIIKTIHSGALAEAKTLYYPGPDIGQQAFLRSQINPVGWSICGITHTTSSAGAMDAIARWLTSPIENWDAIICTSKAVKAHVEKILQAEVNRLQQRLGIQNLPLPQLPVIPLGVHIDEFTFSNQEKQVARNAIQADQDTIVILYMGRLSFHAKAHPLAMYQALSKAAQKTCKKIKLLECGWFANEYTRKAYVDSAKSVCPSIEIIHLDGRDPIHRRTAWASADIFCSLSDNIQETFGITPIESMAAGLPSVVSDWDGYKETIRHGVDGFRIATTLPQPGLGGDLAFRYALDIDNYDFHCGHTCMHISVEVAQAVKAFIALIEDETLRKKMGEAARQRAKAVYDWSSIIPQYEQIWEELETIRLKCLKEKPGLERPQPWPARLDPFTGFAHYSTNCLTKESKILRVDQNLSNSIKRLDYFLNLELVRFANNVIPTRDNLVLLLGKIDSVPTMVMNVISDYSNQRQAFNLRALSILQKLGLIQMVEP